MSAHPLSRPQLKPRHPHRGSALVGFALLIATGCYDPPTTHTASSALDTRFDSNGAIESNVARQGTATSSGDESGQPAWTINDGRRGSPYDPSISQYAYWASDSTSFCYWSLRGGQEICSYPP